MIVSGHGYGFLCKLEEGYTYSVGINGRETIECDLRRTEELSKNRT